MSEQIRGLSDGGKPNWLDGRAGRGEYWLWIVPVMILGIVLAAMRIPGATFFAGVPILLIWIRRLHDIGRSGWFAPLINIGVGVLNFALTTTLPPGPAAAIGAVISFGLIIALGVWPGQPERNAYGPPPGRRKAPVVDVFN